MSRPSIGDAASSLRASDGCVRNPVDSSGRIRAVLFDLDGTLYRQAPVRALMALESLTMPLGGLASAPARWRALLAYRKAHERLRAQPGQGSLNDALISAAAAATGLERGEVERLVNDWMLMRPLKYLRANRARGIEALLDLLERAGVRIGVFSDYPAEGKLRALGLGDRFSPVLCSLDQTINALKPHPRGFLRACEMWQLQPHEVLVVGDRADADAAGAEAAGMSCVIVSRREPEGLKPAGYLALPSMERLHRAFDAA
jgi:putative hydrolase of the HAD superfamily